MNAAGLWWGGLIYLPHSFLQAGHWGAPLQANRAVWAKELYQGHNLAKQIIQAEKEDSLCSRGDVAGKGSGLSSRVLLAGYKEGSST